MTATHVGMIVLGYVLGALPFGVWVAKAKGVDILSVGSGNPGATNVWRTLGPKAGGLVFFLDTVKGAAPAAVASWALKDPSWSLGAGIAAVFGHSLSPFLKFKGGKGVATGFGALLGSAPIIGLLAFAVFLLVLAITRYVSLGSLLASLSILGFGVWLGQPVFVLSVYGILAAFLFYRHRENIQRLLAGTERKFQLKSAGAKIGDGSSESHAEEQP